VYTVFSLINILNKGKNSIISAQFYVLSHFPGVLRFAALKFRLQLNSILWPNQKQKCFLLNGIYQKKFRQVFEGNFWLFLISDTLVLAY